MPYVMRPGWPCEGKRGLKEADLKSALSHTEMAARIGMWPTSGPTTVGAGGAVGRAAAGPARPGVLWRLGRTIVEGGRRPTLACGPGRAMGQTILGGGGGAVRMKPQGRTNSDQQPTISLLWKPSLRPLL